MWIRHHQRGFLWLYVGFWGAFDLIFAVMGGGGLAFYVSPHARVTGPGPHPRVVAGLVLGIVGCVLFTLVSGYIFRVLTARVMLTEREVIVHDSFRTRRIPQDQASRFTRIGSMIGSLSPDGHASFASIALILVAGKPIRLDAFAKFPNSDRQMMYTACTYFDTTITELNRLLATAPAEPGPAAPGPPTD